MIWENRGKLGIWDTICGTKAQGCRRNLVTINSEGDIKYVSSIICSSSFYFSVDNKMWVGLEVFDNDLDKEK